MIQGLKPGKHYKLVVRSRSGDRTLEMVKLTQAPNTRVLIQMDEKFVVPGAGPGKAGEKGVPMFGDLGVKRRVAFCRLNRTTRTMPSTIFTSWMPSKKISCALCGSITSIVFLLWGMQHETIRINKAGCDDGGTTNGDGCDSTCMIEPGFTCTGEPSVCTPTP